VKVEGLGVFFPHLVSEPLGFDDLDVGAEGEYLGYDGSMVGIAFAQGADVLTYLAEAHLGAGDAAERSIDFIDKVVDGVVSVRVAETGVKHFVARKGILVDRHGFALFFECKCSKKSGDMQEISGKKCPAEPDFCTKCGFLKGKMHFSASVKTGCTVGHYHLDACRVLGHFRQWDIIAHR